MSERAVKLFVHALEEMQRRASGGEGDQAPPPVDDDLAERAAWFVDDLCEVLLAPELAEAWDPENVSSEEVFGVYAHVAEGYLRVDEAARRPFLRSILEATRDLREAPEDIRNILPLIVISPAERLELLAHGGITHGAITAEDDAAWPVPRSRIEETAARLTHPDAEPGANFHVKYLKEAGLVTVSKKPRRYNQLQHTAEDLWLFVKLTDEAPRVLSVLGFR